MIDTSIPGVVILEPLVFSDARGYFLSTYDQEALAVLGIKFQVVAESRAQTTRGVLRGLHFQLQHPQARLIEVTEGEIFDVAVDVRLASPTFGCWVSSVLSGDNRLQRFLPPGMAHGYVVLSDTATITLKLSARYSPAFAYGLAWNDPDLGIAWPVSDPILSEKDKHLQTLSQLRGAGSLPSFSELGDYASEPAASCFISYASADYAFADKLRRDLQRNRIACFLAPDDMNAGDRIRETLERAIQSHQKVILILSKASIESSWVEAEVERALDRERAERSTIIVPLTLDSAVFDAAQAWVSHIRRMRHIADFRGSQNDTSYRRNLDRLTAALLDTSSTRS